MNTSSLQCIVRCDPTLFNSVVGIFAADELPKRLQSFPVAFIVNTDKRVDPGRHWVVFYVSSRTKGEFFDSYGNSPSYYSNAFQLFFDRNGLKMTYNQRRLQGYDSSVCGQYCVYYLMQRCRGMEMKSVVEPFTQNYANNDQFVYSYVNHTFPYCMNHLQ